MTKKCIVLVVLSLLVTAGLAIMSVNGWAASTDSDQLRILSEANDFFKQANEISGTDQEKARELYKKSLLRFETLAESGITNGKLYYNIGNVYFRLQDIGRAILNYRKAQRYVPEDENLKQNLTYVISQRLDRIEVRQEEKVLKTLFFWHYDLPQPVRLNIFAGCYLLFWLLAFSRIFFKRPSLNWGLGISLFLLLLFAGSLLSDRYKGTAGQPGVLVAGEVIGRKGDGKTYEPSFKEPLHSGTEFALVEDRGEWLHIELADGRRCWVPAQSAGLVGK